MALTVTIFGVGPKGGSPCFAYACLRQARGTGGYPAPTLPRDAVRIGTDRFQIKDSAIELSTWDHIIEGEDEKPKKDEISDGRFRVPGDSPIEPGVTLEGITIPPTKIAERGSRMICDGTGALWSSGFVQHEGAEKILQCLCDAAGRQDVGEELELILKKIDALLGCGPRLLNSRRLAVVERFWRVREGHRPGLLGAKLVERTEGKIEARQELLIWRDSARLDESLRVQVTLFSSDQVLAVRLVDLPAGISETVVSASSHITGYAIAVFNYDKGELIDQYEDFFCQGANFGVIARSTVDVLPKPFKNAPSSVDLEQRPRIHTATFPGPSGGNRSGGFDILRANTAMFELLVGPSNWRGESRWFSSGPEPQMEVIRWIKDRLEGATIRAAFLADPFLGEAALGRVITRHGNESISLSLAVSPAGINPDADEVNTRGIGDAHLTILRSAAEKLAAQLCGKIEIIHVKRGDGRRQAFHDRYLILVGVDGVPRAYLLSNSLNKAAGDWPFGVLEFDRITSWRVAAYVQNLVGGNDRGRSLTAEKIWLGLPQVPTQTPLCGDPQRKPEVDELSAFRSKAWQTYLRVHSLVEQCGLPVDDLQVNIAIDELIAAWPESNRNPKILAEIIVEQVNGREQHAATIADRLKEAGAYEATASAIDDLLAERILDRLSKADKEEGLPPCLERLDLLRRAGLAIAGSNAGTDVVRNHINPVVSRYINRIESGRPNGGQYRWDPLIAGFCFVIIAFQVAFSASRAPYEHRRGLTVDYVNVLGRLLRSWCADELYGSPSDPGFGKDFASEALTLALQLRSQLGPKVGAALHQLKIDPLVPNPFKTLLID